MALIQCPECGREISNKASACPACGAPVVGGEQGTSAPARPTGPARYDPATDEFLGSMTSVVKLAMHAVQDLGWKLDGANDNLGLVTFQTGISWGSWSGVSGSLNIEEISAGKFRISGSGKQNLRGGQLIALNIGGEAQGKARKAIERMKQLAGRDRSTLAV